jgi:hypothetical protein
MEMSGQRYAPAALPLEKGPRYPLYRRLGGPQSRCGEKSLSLAGNRIPAVQPVAIQTELSRLSLLTIKIYNIYIYIYEGNVIFGLNH